MSKRDRKRIILIIIIRISIQRGLVSLLEILFKIPLTLLLNNRCNNNSIRDMVKEEAQAL